MERKDRRGLTKRSEEIRLTGAMKLGEAGLRYLKAPTCNLEGDGEERGDTRLLLSLGLTCCNYRGDSSISYAHTGGRQSQTNTERGETAQPQTQACLQLHTPRT